MCSVGRIPVDGFNRRASHWEANDFIHYPANQNPSNSLSMAPGLPGSTRTWHRMLSLPFEAIISHKIHTGVRVINDQELLLADCIIRKRVNKLDKMLDLGSVCQVEVSPCSVHVHLGRLGLYSTIRILWSS